MSVEPELQARLLAVGRAIEAPEIEAPDEATGTTRR